MLFLSNKVVLLRERCPKCTAPQTEDLYATGNVDSVAGNVLETSLFFTIGYTDTVLHQTKDWYQAPY